ncbi:Putative metal-dependent hydrolase [Ignavibacterium album JCM 16511]|uniref:Putative metal-dependent hydrolase n=1 Tax=Ignavibacterium album (strain DSM 19864 / JCM 16511 / NBRC 101810 / Mat9-16) TaxID=945713 RepID=I0AIP1_IGNAJ|nr:amidohydrolase [Ignavibacterium album]AFH48848.1 Putative metal-dependent hydrolase [Ignavibacterium album JCM 16511]
MNYLPILIIIFSSIILQAQEMKKAFINGKVYTVNDNQPLAEAVVVEGNKIIFVGSSSDAKKLIDNSTEVIDLKGKLMLPGFIDNHVHFVSGGFYLLGIDLRPAKSTTEFKNILKDYAAKHPGKWITGGYWNHENWEVKDLPTKEMIDEVVPNQPVFVERLDGHMGVANSLALKLAGITKETETPEGGLIVKDISGEPTGVLKDNAMNLIYRVIPEPSDEENYEALLAALEEAKKLGITSVHDITFADALKAFERAKTEGKLTCRIYTRWPIADYKSLVEKNIKAGYGDNLIKMGSLKAFADGSLGSSTAWFFEKYNQDTTTFGLPMDIITDGSMEKWCLDADKNGLQLSVHAIGDRANSYMLDLFEKITKENPEWDRRFRIEHAQHVRFQDIPRFAKLGVIASVQPYHCIDDGVWAEKRIGPERIKYTYPFKSFLEAGVKLCFGTDWYVAPLNPLLGLYAAVTRRTLDDKYPDGWIPEQKISIEDAIKCYTINSAYAAFEENKKGSIEVGKLADLIVLSDDILTIDPVKIKDAEVLMTVFDGKIIYKK